MQIELKIIAIVILLCLSNVYALNCHVGRSVLTRISNNNTFSLKEQCVCPIDYFGPLCERHRGLKCYLTKKSINPVELDESNFAQQITVQMQVNAECYIEQKPAGKKIYQGREKQVQYYIPLLQFMIKRKEAEGNLDYELQSDANGGEIIWANDPKLFYQNGRLRYVQGFKFTLDDHDQKIMSLEDEKKILAKYKPFQFVYKSNFLGLPVSDSKFYISSKVVRPTQNRINIEKQVLQFVNYDEYLKLVNQTSQNTQLPKVEDFFKDFQIDDLLNDNLYDKIKQKIEESVDKIEEISQNKVLPYFKVAFNLSPREATQFKNIRLEVSLLQYYLEDLQVQALSVNGVEFILPVSVPGLGEAKVYSVNFNKKETPRIVYFIVFALLLGLGFLVYYFQNKKHRSKLQKIKKHVDQMQDDIAWK